MLGKYFKVTEDFAPESAGKDGEYLVAEKGDIVVDVVYLDDKYVKAKSMISQRAGKIPRSCIEELQGESESEDKAETPEKKTVAEEKADEVKEDVVLIETSKPDTVAISIGKTSDLTRPPLSQRSLGSFKKPELPKRPAPKCKRTHSMPVTSSFRSRTSDEGYNSSSTYSGERQGQQSNSKSSDDDCFVDTPLLPSQRPRSLSPVVHQMSVQDEDGYEVPMIVNKPGLTIQGDDTIERRKPKLRFVFRKKLDLRNGKEVPKLDDGHGMFRLSCTQGSGFSSPAGSMSPCQSPLKQRNRRRERFLVFLCILVSLLIAMGLFLIFLIVMKLSSLLSLVIATIVFTCTMVVPLTFAKARLACILALLLPSLFSNTVKTALCITLSALLLIGPVLNIATNLDLALTCGEDSSGSSGSLANKTIQHKGTDTPTPSPTFTPVNTPPVIITAALKGDNASAAAVKSQDMNTTIDLLHYCKRSFNVVQEMCLSTQNIIQDTCRSNLHTLREGQHPTVCFFGVDEVCRSSSAIHESCDKLVRRHEKHLTVTSRSQSRLLTLRVVILELLPLLVLVLLFDAYYYTQGYLADKNLDNVYITGKLKVIDQERKERGLKERIFPLRKLEFRKYCLPSSIKLTADEKRQVFRWLCVCMIVGLFLLCLVLLDGGVYDALAKKGFGKLARHCPNEKFTEVDHAVLKATYVIFGILIGFSIMQGYVLRCRSRICASFYPKRETTRGVHLYYKVLQDRAYFWKNCREKVRIAAEARRLRWRTGVAHRVFACLPSILRRGLTKMFIYRCMICNSYTCHRSFVCSDGACSAVFCFECYIDMGESCISCQPSHQATFSLGSPI